MRNDDIYNNKHKIRQNQNYVIKCNSLVRFVVHVKLDKNKCLWYIVYIRTDVLILMGSW